MSELIAKINSLLALTFGEKTTWGESLYQCTLRNLGKDLSPRENELACAETVNTLARLAWGQEIGGDVSTARMYQSLLKDIRFKRHLLPLRGDLIISPTGYGNGRVSNGHVGVVGENGVIMSNNSYNSKLEQNWSLKDWQARYGTFGGFPVVFFRRHV